jgi:ATP-grasp domain, R2K clade family 3
MVNWIIEDGIFDDAIKPLEKEIRLQGHSAKVIDYLGGYANFEQFFPENECILFYGSLKVASRILGDKTRRGLPWVPGLIGTMTYYHCAHYFTHLGQWLLNSSYCILPLAELSRRLADDNDKVIQSLLSQDSQLFIRPNSPLKPFTGEVCSSKQLLDLKKFMNHNGLHSQEMLVVIAPVTEIEAEWRVVICEGQVLTASQYQKSGKPYYQSGLPNEIRALAEEIAQCGWQPDPIWILDLCWSNRKAHLMEIGTLSCSAFYECDLTLIVQEASRIAQEEWNEVI